MLSQVRGKLFYIPDNDSCSDCENFIIIHDCRTGDQICNRCGIVQEEKILITEPPN